MGLKLGALIGGTLLLILPVIYATNITEETNSTTWTCPYEANPFYLEYFEVKEEKDPNGLPVNPKEVLVLEWVHREHVGCELNRNGWRMKEIRLSCSTYRCNISDDCHHFLKTRMNSIKEIVKHNIIVILKTKAIELFNGSPFKRVVFKDKSITDFPEREFWQILNTTMYRLSTGFTVPNRMNKISFTDFEKTFKEGVTLYGEIEETYFVFSDLPGSYKGQPKCTIEDKEKCNDDNLGRLFKIIVGDEDDVGPSGSINFGYVRLRHLLEKGIRYVMKNVGQKDEDIKTLLLPLVPPCFQSFSLFD